MPVTLSIKNVPDEVAQGLRERAARNHRSLQGELLAIVETAASQEITVESLRERVRQLGIASYGDSARQIREDRDSR